MGSGMGAKSDVNRSMISYNGGKKHNAFALSGPLATGFSVVVVFVQNGR